MDWPGRTKMETWTEMEKRLPWTPWREKRDESAAKQKLQAKQQRGEEVQRGVNEELRYMGRTEKQRKRKEPVKNETEVTIRGMHAERTEEKGRKGRSGVHERNKWEDTALSEQTRRKTERKGEEL